MRTSGIDLSADNRKTGVSTIDWGDTTATVVDVCVGADDDHLLEIISSATKTGIDCPFGWPGPFTRFVRAHESGDKLPGSLHGRWRTALQYRQTDLWVQAHLKGVQGLSVAADRIGSTAMRCAVLLERVTATLGEANRAGAGQVVEVYPAASLAAWGLPHKGYKGKDKEQARSEILDCLIHEMSWLDFGGYEGILRSSDDALDALICAVTARCSALNRHVAIPAESTTAAEIEGWIAVPRDSPAHLLRADVTR